MKRRISVFTATRAEYHLLTPVLKRICRSDTLELDLIVSGTHLSERFGHTVDCIVDDGFPIGETIETIGDEIDADEVIAKTLIACGRHFSRVKPEFLIVLGDRYEILGAVIAAANANIPIAHIHGGETTEGAIDEAVRHAVTKFSFLHFASCEPYRRRIIQLGESPDRVFNAGALGVENILHHEWMTRRQLSDNLNFDLTSYALVTVHPVTLEEHQNDRMVTELISALLRVDNLNYLVTMANADKGGEEINRRLKQLEREHPERVKLVPSLGMVRYLSAIRHCKAVIGNSSSGLLEAPSFGVPTVNIGDRQKGRIRAKSVIDCDIDRESVTAAIHKALSEDFAASLKGSEALFGRGETSEIIVSTMERFLNEGIKLTKEFYDLKAEG